MKRFLLMIPMVLLLLTACGSKQAPSAEIPADGALEIPVSELSEKIQIYSFTLDGLNMEVLAAKDADGTVRTAFNTCQVCNAVTPVRIAAIPARTAAIPSVRRM